jgi:hypothetical protein
MKDYERPAPFFLDVNRMRHFDVISEINMRALFLIYFFLVRIFNGRRLVVTNYAPVQAR